jgi:hypothetical protein
MGAPDEVCSRTESADNFSAAGEQRDDPHGYAVRGSGRRTRLARASIPKRATV